MAAFAGWLIPHGLNLVALQSPNISDYDFSGTAIAEIAGVVPGLGYGTWDDNSAGHTVGPTDTFAGWVHELYGSEFFERIHVIPTRKDYGFIISSQVLPVEVWNSNRVLTRILTDILEVGPEGVVVNLPVALPYTFGAFESVIFLVDVLNVGGARAANDIHWDFSGVIEPHLLITGLRLVPFTIPIDWDFGIDDTKSWLTDIIEAWDESEQRIALRVVPKRKLTFKVSAMDERESGLLDSLLWGWMARSYGVPMWMNRGELTSAVVLDQTIIPVDTTAMELVAGMQVLLLVDPFTWYASTVLAFTGASITLETGVDAAYPARTTVVPVLLGRLPAEVTVERPTNHMSIVTASFDLEVVE